MKDVDGGKDPDPIYKIMINLELESDGSPTSMTVTHASMKGKYYSRHEQYTVNPEWFWSGTLARDRSLRMKGALIKNATGIHYQETLGLAGKYADACPLSPSRRGLASSDRGPLFTAAEGGMGRESSAT